MSTDTARPRTSADYAAESLAIAKGRAAARAAMLPAFVAQAAAIHASFELTVQTREELRAVLVAIGGHNNFDPETAAELLGPQVHEMMEVSIKSCADGPYLYFKLPYYDGHRLIHLSTTNSGEKLTEDHRMVLAQRLVELGHELQADMIRVVQGSQPNSPSPVYNSTGKTPYEIALWWD